MVVNKLKTDIGSVDDIFMNDFPEIIRWMFSKNLENLYEATEHFEEYQRDLIELLKLLKLAEVLQQDNCSGIQDKFADATNWHKLICLASELSFAKKFFSLGFTVSLIPDSSFEWRDNNQQTPSPDLCVTNNSQQMLIEVARISGDETIAEIQDILGNIVRQTCFRISIQYSKEFSIPVISYEDREKRKKIIDYFAEEFKKILSTVDPKILPQSREILGCKVKFEKSPLKQGYFSGSLTAALISPHEKIKPHIKYILETKAKKREKFPEQKRKLPYLVALDIQQGFFWSDEHLVPLLFGGRHYLGSLGKPGDPGVPSFPDPLVVREAKECGWREFLESVGFDEGSDSPINPNLLPGILLTNTTIATNLTGIIVINGENLQVVPNPFAEKPINCPDLHNLIPLLSKRERLTA
jgi:hypothetical protein